MAEQWGPWIEHDGTGCPVKGHHGEYVWEDGDSFVGNIGRGGRSRRGDLVKPHSGSGSWEWRGRAPRVIRYRVRQYSALTDLKAICENPQPVREDA